MRIARTFSTLVAVAAAAAIAAGPALADPAAPVPAVPVAPAPAAAAPAPAAAPAAAVPAAATPGTGLVSTANAVPAGSQPALAELAKIPGVQQIISSGQLPTTDVATLVKMFGSDPQAQKLIGQVLAGQTATGPTPASSTAATTPDEPLKFPVTGAFNDAFSKDGGQTKYGQPLAAEKDLAGGGKQQEFTKGTIFWSPKVNAGRAAGVTGAIRDLYLKEGGPTGKLGLPVMSELTIGGATPDAVAGAYNDFQNGSIVWSPEGGAQVVSGKIKDQWVKGGGVFGVGYPKGPAKPGPGGTLTQEFTKGGVLKA